MPADDQESNLFSQELQQQRGELITWWGEQSLPEKSIVTCVEFLQQAAASTPNPVLSEIDLLEQFKFVVMDWQRVAETVPAQQRELYGKFAFSPERSRVRKRMRHRQDDQYIILSLPGIEYELSAEVAEAISQLSEWEFHLLRKTVQGLVSPQEIEFTFTPTDDLKHSPVLSFLACFDDSLPDAFQPAVYPFLWALSPPVRKKVLHPDNESVLTQEPLYVQIESLAERYHVGSKGIVGDLFLRAGEMTRPVAKQLHRFLQYEVPSGSPEAMAYVVSALGSIPWPVDPRSFGSNGRNGDWYHNTPPELFPTLEIAFQLLQYPQFHQCLSETLGIDLQEGWLNSIYGAPQHFSTILDYPHLFNKLRYYAAALLLIRNMLDVNGTGVALPEYLAQVFPGQRVAEVELGNLVTADLVIVDDRLPRKITTGLLDPSKLWGWLRNWDELAQHRGSSDTFAVTIVEIKTGYNLLAPPWHFEQQVRGVPKHLRAQFISHLQAARLASFRHIHGSYNILRVTPLGGVELFRDLQHVFPEEVNAEPVVTPVAEAVSLMDGPDEIPF